jgi:magnesium-transporting ATPase (P-type)
MGKTGTAVAREAGDMILADDNFATFVAAVEEGRIVFERIRKVVGYLVATNAGELLTFTIAVASGMPLPLIAVQILWINLVTDSGPSLALSVDPPTSDVLAKPPRNPSERVINRPLLATLAVVAPAMAIAGFGAFFIGLEHGLSKARTLVFLTLALSQLFNAINVRAGSKSVFRTPLFANRWLIISILIALAFQALPIHVPLLQKPFNTIPVSMVDWAISIGLASIVLWTAEIRKLIIRWLNLG